MEGRKWEDLPTDCLVKIFAKVGIESQLLDVPFVCKSWHTATLNSLCWQVLDFPEISCDKYYDYDASIVMEESRFVKRLMDSYNLNGDFSFTDLLKNLVNRSRQSVTLLRLPSCCEPEALAYVADNCPALKALVLRGGLPLDCQSTFPSLINKWKNLEFLVIRGNTSKFREIVTQVSIHCPNFVGLGVPCSYIDENRATTIATMLPKLKYLSITRAEIEWKGLVMILKSCRELLKLEASRCTGFEEDDEEILKLGSHIKEFNVEGSFIDYWEEPINSRDAGFDDGNFSD